MLSKNIQYMPRLDHLRFLAAGLVFSFHLFHYYFGQWKPHPHIPYYGLITEGHTGIALFFVLSGFIFMTIALQKGELNYAQFIRNRFLRIFPLFLLVFFIAISIGRDSFQASDIFYVFFSNLGDAPTSDAFITGAAWTISVEFSFYLLFPFLAQFTRDQGPTFLLRLILILLVVKIAAYHVAANPTHMFYSTLVGRFDQFLWGMLAAWIYHFYGNNLKQFANLLLLIGLCLVVFAIAYQAKHASFFLPKESKPQFWIFWSSGEALLWGLVITAYMSSPFKIPNFMDKFMAWGGELSYSFYLWHGLIIFLMYQYIGVITPFSSLAANLLVNFVIVLPIIMGFAWLSYKTIELPFLGLRKRYF